jgi:hypothetical protein
MQVAAARELYSRGWAYDTTADVWALQPTDGVLNGTRLPADSAQNLCVVFVPQEWKPKHVKMPAGGMKFATVDEVCGKKTE